MHKCLIATFFVLTLAAPVAAKESKVRGGNPKPNYALVIDIKTGKCEVRKLGFQSDAPEGFRLLDNYESQKSAEAAESNTPECRTGTGQNAAKNEAAVKAAEKDCHSVAQTVAQKSGSSLLGLFSRATSEEATFVECMKQRGYDAKK